MKCQLLALLCLALFSSTVHSQCSTTPRDADNVALANPGITANELSSASAGRGSRFGACSEVVNVYTMGYTLPAWERTNCPHLRTDLTPFESSFTPANGDDVTVTSSQKLLFSACSLNSGVALNRLTVSTGGVLVFNDQDIALSVREIVVQTGAYLYIGSETCRLYSRVNITFTGSQANSGVGQPSKGMIVEGTVEVHGKQYHPTWTRLARTAQRGDTIVFVQDPLSSWEVGQQVLLTTTVFQDCPTQFGKFCSPCEPWALEQALAGNTQYSNCLNYNPHQNEIRTIVALSAMDGTVEFAVKLDSPLTYTHWASLEYQGELALLSRRIRLIGADSGDNFGYHARVQFPNAIGRFSGVESLNGGQLNVLGSYPFHFHMMNSAATSYIQECVVRDSNFRAYTIHGTNDTRLSRSIAYNVKGFAVYLEDGVEENNLIEYNLMAHVHPIDQPADGGGGQGGEQFTASVAQIIPADASASGYYLSNAYNDVVGNVASGGWSGFAFPNIPYPLGMFKGLDYGNANPMNRPTKSFVGNTAHSSGFYWSGHGSCIYTGAWLYYDTAGVEQYDSGRHERNTIDPNGDPTATMLFEDTKTFACLKGVAHWGDRIILRGFEAHDVQNAAMLFGNAAISDALVTARTLNHDAWYYQDHTRYVEKFGFQFYDTWVKTILSKMTFRGYNQSGDTAVRYMDHSDHYTPQGINSVVGLRFESTTRSNILRINACGPDCGSGASGVDWDPTMSSRIYSVWDWDGSLAQTPGTPTIMGSNQKWWKFDDSTCTKDADWGLWKCQWLSKRTVVYLELHTAGLGDGCFHSPSIATNCTDQYSPFNVGTVTQWGRDSTHTLAIKPWGAGLAGISNTGWHWRPKLNFGGYNVEGAPSFWTLGSTLQMEKGNFVVISVRYPAATTFSVRVSNSWWGVDYPNLAMAASKAVVTTPTEDVLPASSFDCSGIQWYDFCSATGGVGPAWYWDGTHFYLRVVPLGCYNNNQKDECESAFFSVDGVRVPEIFGGFEYQITATCTGCPSTSFDGVDYFTVADSVPAAFAANHGSLVRVPLPLTRSTQHVCPPMPLGLPTQHTGPSTTGGSTTNGGVNSGSTNTASSGSNGGSANSGSTNSASSGASSPPMHNSGSKFALFF